MKRYCTATTSSLQNVLEKITLASTAGWTVLKPSLHSRISLVAIEIFVIDNQKNEAHPTFLYLISEVVFTAWRSGYCYLNKGECNLNQSKDDSFVERVAKNNSWNNGDRHKIHEIILINCFVFVITPVWKTVHSSAMTQSKAHLMEKTLQLTVPR